jgi:mRNA interferase MazF
MVRSVEGIYRNGKIELTEPLPEAEASRVIVTWVRPVAPIDLFERGLNEVQAHSPKIGIGPKWRPTMNYHRGDVVLVLFPDSNLRSSKRRPALVVQADGLCTGLQQVIVSMITSNLSRAGHPSRVTVSVGGGNAPRTGLLMDSVIATDNLGYDSRV